MRQTRLRISLLGIMLGCFLQGMPSQIAFADDADFAIAQVAVIAKSEDAARILIDPGDLSELDGELVTSAFLELTLPGLIPSQDIDVYVTALETDWVGKAPTWTTPWSEPGGDLDETYARTTTLLAGKSALFLSIDVTQFVRDIADRQSASNGFLLTLASDVREGFSADEAAVMGSMTEAKLRVKYVKISSLGYNDGSLSFIDRD